MGQNAKPWTVAIDAFLADGETYLTEDALAAGAAVVPEERALQEMGDKQSAQSDERRIQIGRRNVAMQAITGMIRFGKAEYVNGKKSIRKVGNKSRSIGELASRVDILEADLSTARSQIESMQAQLDRLDSDSEGQVAGEAFLAAAGVNSSTD